MSQDLQDEVTSINSIYGEQTLQNITTEDTIYTLTFPSQPEISLRLEFPLQYPDAPPSILGTQTVGSNVAKGDGAYLVDLTRDALAEVYTPGAPCVYDLVEEVDARLKDLRLADQAHGEDDHAPETSGRPSETSTDDNDYHETSISRLIGEEPSWVLSEVITEKKSVFIARCAAVTSVDQAKDYLTHLLLSDRKVAKATHNITTWRIQGENGVQYQDCDDDGETAAGSRLLHLLELMKVWGAMVVVTRWYGGVQLGPDRFRIINQTARDALVKAGFGQDVEVDGKRKKGRK